MSSAAEEFYKEHILQIVSKAEKITLTNLSKNMKRPKSTIFRWVSLFKAKDLIATEYVGRKTKKGRELLIKKI